MALSLDGDAAIEVKPTSYQKELQRLLDHAYLQLAIERNLLRAQQFVWNLQDRFGTTVGIPRDGKPKHIRGLHNGPYLTRFRPISDRVSRPIPLAVVDEWKAIVIQGWGLTQKMLVVDPEYPREWLFPLDLRS